MHVSGNRQRGWIEYYLEKEIPVPLDNVAESSVYFGAKNLMAYAQLCLVAQEMGRQGKGVCCAVLCCAAALVEKKRREA